MKRLWLCLLVFAFLPVSLAAQRIRVTNPGAGVSWGRGASHEITWTRTGEMDSNVRIVLLRADGTNVGRIVNTTPNDGSYTWEIPADTEPGSYKIRVVTVDGAVRDTSADFTILMAAHSFTPLRVMEAVVAPCNFGIEAVTFADGTDLNHGISYPSGGNLTGLFQVRVGWNGTPPGSGCSYSIEVKNVMTNQVVSGTNNPANFTQANADSSKRVRINVPFTVPAADVYRSIRNRAIPLEFKLLPSRNDCDSDAANNRRSENMRILNIPVASDFAVEVVPGSLSCDRSWSIVHRHDSIRLRIRFRVMNLSRTDSGAPAAAVNNVKYKYRIEYTRSGHNSSGEPATWTETQLSSEGTFPTVTSTGWTEKAVDRTFNMITNFWAPVYFIVVIDPDEEFFDPNRSNNRIRFEFRLPPE